ncbi:MAG: biotin carboxyl carrier protein [Acidobacteriaceae bacterium]|nr:biotin carboxyl carrier protein [Acidobacteriaceae bacterium]
MIFYEVSIGGRSHQIQIERAAGASSGSTQHQPNASRSNEVHCNLRLDGREIQVSYSRSGSGALSLIVNGESFDVTHERIGESLRIFVRGRAYECSVRDPRSLRTRKRAGVADAGEQKLTASMPGKVVRILASVGDQIATGQGILVIEAMKMQNEVRSPKEGQLKKLLVREGANVVAGEVLAIIE